MNILKIALLGAAVSGAWLLTPGSAMAGSITSDGAGPACGNGSLGGVSDPNGYLNTTNLVNNCSFEVNTVGSDPGIDPSGSWVINSSQGYTNIANTATSGIPSVDAPNTGTYFAEIGDITPITEGIGAGSGFGEVIQQTLVGATAGDDVLVTFSEAEDLAYGDGDNPNELSVSWNGTQVLDFLNQDLSGYNQYSFIATSNGTGDLLTFAGIQTAGDFLIDDVTAYDQGQPIPEPASLALLGAGLSGLGLIRRRKKA